MMNVRYRPPACNNNIIYLESENNSPYQTQVQTGIAIYNIVGTNVLQMDPLVPEEL